ncbi:MAG: nitroreductase family protein [Bacteroidaceae bacterium]|nr:nitroreductase family protein [Bacteroidaceae bacterium]
MKKLLFPTVATMAATFTFAQDIKLPAVDVHQKSLSVVEALATRHSVRTYSSKELSTQELSNLCWAACGVSRNNDFRTSPTARNRKEVRLYVFTTKGVYEYLPVENILKESAKGDHRKLVAGTQGFSQDFVLEAPVSLVMVVDLEKLGGQDERSKMMGCVDAGNVSENINLYCQSVGLCTVPRATMDTSGIRSLLGLTDKQIPVMNNPVGYPK